MALVRTDSAGSTSLPQTRGAALLLVVAVAAVVSGSEAVAVAAAYCVAGLCLLPVAPLDLACGALFGVPLGIVCAQLSAMLAAAAAFLAARATLGEDGVAGLLGRARVRALARRIERNAGWSVFLARLSPCLPFALLSWTFGGLRVPFRTYLVATFVATLPKTALYVALGVVVVLALALLARRRALRTRRRAVRVASA